MIVTLRKKWSPVTSKEERIPIYKGVVVKAKDETSAKKKALKVLEKENKVLIKTTMKVIPGEGVKRLELRGITEQNVIKINGAS